MKIAIIGGGAAGFFAAISAKEHHPSAEVTIYEKTSKVLAKVKVSGGGRCNVTHACLNNVQLSKFYPRGEKLLKKAFGQFAVQDTINWFEARGVELKTEADNRMFPVTNDSQTIIDCLLAETRKLDIKISLKTDIREIEIDNNGFALKTDNQDYNVSKVIVTTGGSPKASGLQWLADLGHSIETPVPSLFTFNMPGEPIKELMGLAVPHATAKVQGSKLKAEGPALVTHWGMSGPAVLKLSAFGARELADKGYKFNVQINWPSLAENDLRTQLSAYQEKHHKKKVINGNPVDIPARLWEFLLNKIELREDIQWGELGGKSMNKMVNIIVNDTYQTHGKTTFKEEFVTCGGISLQDISPASMQSKKVPGMYFAGEVLDIDGVTGGFNFQAAWTTGFIAGKLLE
ncbi:NAD(P)/FAD-dependent oxidoreductase [Fulvivirga ligni]|uniref:NAD(P)/FAD-dependent oxidoreductase n=1 Tax=Fulvivirga ligni TaxID=2904246 RepID=UPI001F3C8F22|nr:NAD(P)/FAD-dependent oxidoreductase [Fulvivirga ligni]UII19469.1 NAD(P)/FAD-dependent oxidoreductase [Fulvivirga ligni]